MANLTQNSKQKQEFRSQFLKAYVRVLILGSYRAPKTFQPRIDMSELREGLALRDLFENNLLPPIPFPPPRLSQSENENPKNLFPRLFHARGPMAQSSMLPSPLKVGGNAPINPVPLQTKKGEPLSSGSLKKIEPLLHDPAVLSIECPGPGKNILVNKAGLIQASPIKLAKDEIDDLLKEIADKTRIPLVQGLFKAAYSDYLISAVISDFIGTRFMVQKRTPFQQY